MSVSRAAISWVRRLTSPVFRFGVSASISFFRIACTLLYSEISPFSPSRCPILAWIPGVASVVDQEEARKAGVAAFEAAVSGKWKSGSIAIRRKKGRKYAVAFDVVPLRAVAKETRSMPDEFISENGHDVTDAFLAYARPLVGELPVKAMLRGV